jgi:signal transduction histidine kinase/ferredoxin
MPRLTVIADGGAREIYFTGGTSLREILDASAIPVRSGCRGNGACGFCTIQIEAGNINDPTENEQAIISSRQLDQGIRLACQVMPENNLCVRFVKPLSKSEEGSLTPNHLRFSPSLFETFIKLAQYIVRIKGQEDLWVHLGKFVLTYFPAAWTAFVQRDAVSGISIQRCTLPDEVVTQPVFMDKIRPLIADVLDTGFLASAVINSPSPSMTVFLPVMEEYRPTKVMLIGHKSADSLPKELLNIYLAIASLAGTTCERLQNERELNGYRAHLEELVKERTAELDAAYKELEAFSYSVSHDLRSPLRSIDGFSQVLLEDYNDKLDADGTESLRRIRAASQRMGLLIDGLLALSRISRAELKRERVNISALVRDIARVLQETEPDREVEFVISEELFAEGDERLLYAALQNLVGNAWKFTQKRSTASIEFGAMETDGKPVYFVRDNGAGFDMAYANKLFSIFQRLHDSAEFSGTGIGLATVQRIVHRHGGRLWAEGKVGKGATFYFTLK